MSVKEIVTFIVEGGIKVEVTGSDLIVHFGLMDSFGLTRQQAKDLSKALLHASEIVRTKRKT